MALSTTEKAKYLDLWLSNVPLEIFCGVFFRVPGFGFIRNADEKKWMDPFL